MHKLRKALVFHVLVLSEPTILNQLAVSLDLTHHIL